MRTLMIVLLAVLSITPAYADGDRGGWGRHGGWEHREGGWRHEGGGGGFWILPALVTGAVIYEATRPRTVYVEPAPVPPVVVAPAPQAASTWYYCPTSRAYYPYVATCASQWQMVPAVPPAP
jgi:hypothetical protein